MAGQNNGKQGGQQQDVNQLLKVRREKLANLQEAGQDPFQITKYDVTHHTSDVKELYNAHEEKLLAGRPAVSTDGMDEAAAREAVKADYEERRSIMDADPVHVSIAGRMMFKRVMGKASFANIQDLKGSIQIYVARDAIGYRRYLGCQGIRIPHKDRRNLHPCGGDDSAFQVFTDSSGEIPWTDRHGHALPSEIH